MEGWGWQSVHDPETLPAVVERWKASLATGESFDMVFPLHAELLEADRRKDEFLATLAHELRNPLAPSAQLAADPRNARDGPRTWPIACGRRWNARSSTWFDSSMTCSTSPA
jgi:hypothetical protein